MQEHKIETNKVRFILQALMTFGITENAIVCPSPVLKVFSLVNLFVCSP